MAKIAMLLPNSSMIEPALYAAGLYHLELSAITVLEYGTTLETAESVVKNGADVIIARGGQAIQIAGHVNVPVVEIKLTAYEISLLIEKARLLSDKETPFIALTGPDNMYVDIDIPMFEERYSVRFKPYFFHHSEDMQNAARTAIEDGADVLIGGKDVFRYCEERNVPCLRTFSGRESILEACRVAQLVGNSLEQAREYSASLNMLLNHSSSGIIQIDVFGHILRVNQFVEHLLLMDNNMIKGRIIWELIPGITQKSVYFVFEKQKELHSLSVRYGRSEFIVSIVPVIVEGTAASAIISFHEGMQLEAQMENQRKALLQKGFTAKHTFESMIARSPQMQTLCEQAKKAGVFQFPILILGPSGTEKQRLAECIHNCSSLKKYPFIRFNCNGYNPDEVDKLLFGKSENPEDSGLVYNGPCTLYLHEISELSSQAQYHLLSLIQNNSAFYDPQKAGGAKDRVRFIVSSQYDLMELVNKGQFRRDLYYCISIMTLQIPPLCERREDIAGWIDYHLNGLQKQYGRYIKLTKDALKYLEGYSWPGNLLELRTVCDRILVNCEHYYVDSRNVELLLDHSPAPFEKPISAIRDDSEGGPASKAEQLINVLHKYEGNREAAAAELKISTTTLWRWMKKYRIPKDEGKRS